ncbi:MAG: DUF11 domain-containing protein [Clostridium sp.]
MRVINECRVDYRYRLGTDSPIIRKTIDSNMVYTEIIKDVLLVEKSVNKKCVNTLEILTYEIIISNISYGKVKNIFFRDILEKHLMFIKNSVEINGESKRCLNVYKGFFIRDLLVRDEEIITFKVLAMNKNKCSIIENHATVEFDHIYNIEECPKRREKDSNKVLSKCENNLFKQINLLNYIYIPNTVQKIKGIKYKIEILETKLLSLKTSELCRLLVIGKIEYQTIYNLDGINKIYEDCEGFSTCMLVPIGANYTEKVDIKGYVEYISAHKINDSIMAINIDLLLQY